MRPSEEWHKILSQPTPYGSYVRKVVQYHFPKYWSELSHTLYENGYNLKEMNEYDGRIVMPELTERFDNTRF